MDERVEKAVAAGMGAVSLRPLCASSIGDACRSAIEAYRKAEPAQLAWTRDKIEHAWNLTQGEKRAVDFALDVLADYAPVAPEQPREWTIEDAARLHNVIVDAGVIDFDRTSNADMLEWLREAFGKHAPVPAPSPEQPRKWTRELAESLCERWFGIPPTDREAAEMFDAGLHVLGKLAPVPAAEHNPLRPNSPTLLVRRELVAEMQERAHKAEAEVERLISSLDEATKATRGARTAEVDERTEKLEAVARAEKAEAEVAKLRAELDDAKRRADPPCSVCAGSKVLLTGEPCLICEQTGLESFESVGLRNEIYKARFELDRLRAEHARLREACGPIVKLTEGGMFDVQDITRSLSFLRGVLKQDAEPKPEAAQPDIAKLAADVERLKAAAKIFYERAGELDYCDTLEALSDIADDALDALEGK